MYNDLPGCLSPQFTTQLQIYTNSHLASYPTEVAKYYTTFPKYFPDGCFVVYRLLFASLSVSSKLVRPFRSFSVPFRSFSVPFRSFSVLFGSFRSFSVLFGPFRSFSVLFGVRPHHFLISKLLHRESFSDGETTSYYNSNILM